VEDEEELKKEGKKGGSGREGVIEGGSVKKTNIEVLDHETPIEEYK
jgi:hypothetical protein